ncbi:nitrilase-related carbon-nitrogen hydrolase [Bosea thiooxidans]|nr:nitrilase-related carbon-nitrogen hydrolase [Bosea sp. (in: a-proteobacteria)]
MSGRRFRIGLTQWHVTRDREQNLDQACSLIRACGKDRADLVLLPENALFLGSNAEMRDASLPLEAPAFGRIAELAQEIGAPVLIGGVKRRDEAGTIWNSAVLCDRKGGITSIYDKIHLFDATIGGQRFQASQVESAGATPVVLDHAGATLGISICYDVRFPELYRKLTFAGAEILLVPAAFTRTTGAAHWEILLRARAIENSSFVVASATVSSHQGVADGFETYGHAMAIDPWGRVLADLGEEAPSSTVIELDLSLLADIRTRLPSLSHVRPDAYAAEIVRHTL